MSGNATVVDPPSITRFSKTYPAVIELRQKWFVVRSLASLSREFLSTILLVKNYSASLFNSVDPDHPGINMTRKAAFQINRKSCLRPFYCRTRIYCG
jgi:hypothetical protein